MIIRPYNFIGTRVWLFRPADALPTTERPEPGTPRGEGEGRNEGRRRLLGTASDEEKLALLFETADDPAHVLRARAVAD